MSDLPYAASFVALAYTGTFVMLVAPLTRKKAHLAVGAVLLLAAGVVCAAWYAR